MQGYLEKDAKKKIGARIILYHIDWFSLICGEFYAIMNSGGDNMRQADSTIRGYLYQFNKSIYEILQSNDDEEITLEGVIEDIDIQSPTSTTTIQCKYHEDKKYLISGVAAPILEMLCHYYECHALGKSVSQFKKAVILSKEKNNPGMEYITYDTPIYFDIWEVYRYIKNKNAEVISKKEGDPHLPKRKDGTLIEDPDTVYLTEDVEFAATSQAGATKASIGPYNGEFERFITRLETKLSDKRLKFITRPEKEDKTPYTTQDFAEILKQFLGYIDKCNVTIIDLSAIPFEVLSIVISLLSRVIFDFAFHYSKIRHHEGLVNDIPFMLVCEEAHNYIPKNGGAEYAASKHSIERIAKEGRKYGLNLMVVSQRPSEVSETIFSQCNNFLVLKLTNVNDQNCIKNLLPDNNATLVDVLPTLSAGECLVVGDAVPLPAVVKMDMPNPVPNSSNVNVYDEWNKDWIDIAFEDVISRWRKE